MALLLAGCGQTHREIQTHHQVNEPGIPRALVLESRPIGHGARFHPPASGPIPGRCSRRLGRREGAHVEVFAANRVVVVPQGVGTRGPRRLDAGRIVSAACYGDIVTLEPTGVVLVRAGRRLVLNDLFRAWGQPLTPRRLVGFTGPVSVFVGGRRWRGEPGRVRLTRHAEIAIEIGPRVPPHRSYTFPPGA
jgi:hypothetical protein